MMPTELRYDWVNDETCDIYVKETFVMSMNHDDHGWTGMDTIQAGFNRLACVMGWKISVQGEPGI